VSQGTAIILTNDREGKKLHGREMHVITGAALQHITNNKESRKLRNNTPHILQPYNFF
jgi:hypothetical protein